MVDNLVKSYIVANAYGQHLRRFYSLVLDHPWCILLSS